MQKYEVGKAGDIRPGQWKVVTIEGRSIGIYNKEGEFYALRNTCPHQQAELCKGNVTGTTLPSKPHEYIYGREEEIVVCPWHGWEFDLKTGHSLAEPQRYKVRTYQVSIENQNIILHV